MFLEYSTVGDSKGVVGCYRVFLYGVMGSFRGLWMFFRVFSGF